MCSAEIGNQPNEHEEEGDLDTKNGRASSILWKRGCLARNGEPWASETAGRGARSGLSGWSTKRSMKASTKRAGKTKVGRTRQRGPANSVATPHVSSCCSRSRVMPGSRSRASTPLSLTMQPRRTEDREHGEEDATGSSFNQSNI